MLLHLFLEILARPAIPELLVRPAILGPLVTLVTPAIPGLLVTLVTPVTPERLSSHLQLYPYYFEQFVLYLEHNFCYCGKINFFYSETYPDLADKT
jgi:hypothetical protein